MSPLLVHERKLGIMIKKLLLTTVLTALFSSLGWAKHSDRVVDVGTAKQLFVDDDVIRSMERAYRVLNQPVKYEGNPVLELKPEQKVGGQDLVVVMGNVSYDAEEQIFKMWYDAAVYDWSKVFLGYATSKDGIRWELPNLGLLEHQGSKDNNLVFTAGRGEVAGGVFKDAIETDPERRYKMIYHLHGSPGLGTSGNGIGIAFSADGIHWKRATGKPVIPMADSPNSVMWDPRLGKYVAHTRVNPVYLPPDWKLRRDLRDELWPGAEGSFLRREVLQSESDDFLKWESRGVIMSADREDPPWNQQFYNMEWMPYGDVYFGFIAVYHTLPGLETATSRQIESGPDWLDTVDIQLAFSRDGRTWERAGGRNVFLPLGTQPRDFDRSMVYVMQHPLVVEDEIRIYYVGFSGLHWATRREEVQGGKVGLAKLRMDGFVSIDAGNGVLTTKPIRMSGARLLVNADSGEGSVAVEILEPGGTPIEGFGRKDAVAAKGDSLRHTMKWTQGSDVSRLKGRPLVLKFHLERSRLFSFRFAD